MAYIEDYIQQQLAMRPDVQHLVLICTSINYIDTTAVEALEHLIHTLHTNQITLSLAEVKGPVMDQLKRTKVLSTLSPDKVFLRTCDAVDKLLRAKEI